MAKKFPLDEFDSATVHGGRHRARRTAKDRVLEWIRIFVAAALVAAAADALPAGWVVVASEAFESSGLVSTLAAVTGRVAGCDGSAPGATTLET